MVRVDDERLSIGAVARAAGLSVDTVRYYEREGLIPPVARDSADRRRFDVRVLDALEVVGVLRSAGFGITEIRTFMQIRRPGSSTEDRLAAANLALRDLEHTLAERRQALEHAQKVVDSMRAELDEFTAAHPGSVGPAPCQDDLMIRTERDDDRAAVGAVIAAAFAGAPHSAPPQTEGGPPGEVTLVEWLRSDPAWIPNLSLVATWAHTPSEELVIGHAVATRGWLETPHGVVGALGVGPVSVHPDHQDQGIGSALVWELIARAEAMDEVALVLLGEPEFYGRFGFRAASAVGVDAPDPSWGDYFQVRPLGEVPAGRFRYPPPFDRLAG